MPSALAATCIMAIELAESEQQLASWWKIHQGALRLLPKNELAAVIAAKDRAKTPEGQAAIALQRVLSVTAAVETPEELETWWRGSAELLDRLTSEGQTIAKTAKNQALLRLSASRRRKR